MTPTTDVRSGRWRIAAIALTALLVLSGCGSDDEGSGAPTDDEAANGSESGGAPTDAAETSGGGTLTLDDTTEIAVSMQSCDIDDAGRWDLFGYMDGEASQVQFLGKGDSGGGFLYSAFDENGKNSDIYLQSNGATAVLDGTSVTITGAWNAGGGADPAFPEYTKGRQYTFAVTC